MKCSNCGTEIKEGHKFCTKCGQRVGIPESEPTQLSTDQDSKQKKPNMKKSGIGSQILGLVTTIVAFAIGRYLGLAYFVLLIPAVIGWWLGGLAAKKESFKAINFIAWSNVLTWLLPPLGLATSVFTINYNEHVSNKSKQHNILAIIGIVLSVGNGLIGVIMKSGNLF